jgi:hypothetical protein
MDDLLRALAGNRDTSRHEAGIEKHLPGGDFDVTFTAFNVQRSPIQGVRVIPNIRGVLRLKEGRRGVAGVEAMHADPGFRRLIEGLDPDRDLVAYFVYADSFELFRSLRDSLLSRRLNYRWEALATGNEVTYYFSVGGDGTTLSQ